MSSDKEEQGGTGEFLAALGLLAAIGAIGAAVGVGALAAMLVLTCYRLLT